MDLPKNERTFHFTAEGEATSKKYEGEFRVLCVPNMANRRAIEIEKSRLSADLMNPSDGLSGLAIILSNLRVRVLDGPEWWKQSNGGMDIFDENVVVQLYDKVLEQETLWRAELKAKAAPKEEGEESGLGNSQEESKK